MKSEILKHIVAVVFFTVRDLFRRTISVKGIDETIDELVQSKRSLIRFGDGEVALIRGFDLRFQLFSDELQQELINALSTKSEDLMIAIPDVYSKKSLSQYKRKDQQLWIDEAFFSYPIYKKYCKTKAIYDSLVSRLYLPFNCEYEIIKKRFDTLKTLAIEYCIGA